MSTMNKTSSEDDEQSFEFLGSSPPPSIAMEKSTVGTSMSLIIPQPVSITEQPIISILNSEKFHSTASSSMCPSFTVSQIEVDDILKLPCSEHQKMKKHLEKIKMNNECQATVIQEWQNTKNEEIERLKQKLMSTKTENERLTKEISEKDAVIQNFKAKNERLRNECFEDVLVCPAKTSKSMHLSLYEQFPSLNTSQVQMDDIKKLSSLVQEYQQMKELLEKQNMEMKGQATVMQEWQDTVKQRIRKKNDEIDRFKKELASKKDDNERLTKEMSEKNSVIHAEIKELKLKDEESSKRAEEMTKQLQGMQDENELLTKEKTKLKQKLDEIVAQFNTFQVSAKKEISDMTMVITEKDTIIKNIYAENERLQLKNSDLVVLHKNRPVTVDPVDFVPKSEHEGKVRGMRHRLSLLAAKNLEFEDMKAKLTAAEESKRDMQDKIAKLRLIFDDTRKRTEEMKKQLKQNLDESLLLKELVRVYQKDVQQEREAREKLVTELERLKQKNKKLIDNTRAILNNDNLELDAAGAPAGTSNGATRKETSDESERHMCPICNHELRNLTLLQQHINICLKD